jgi:transposase
MRDASFFTHPIHDWQRRYETLRASFVERLPPAALADRFGYSPAYIRLLRHQFRHGKIDFSEPVPEGEVARRRVSAQMRRTISEYRQRRLSAGQITELLVEDGVEISVRTVERVLAEQGFPKLPRRTRLKIGLTVKGATVPERAEAIRLGDLDGQSFESAAAGVFVFAPFLARFPFA